MYVLRKQYLLLVAERCFCLQPSKLNENPRENCCSSGRAANSPQFTYATQTVRCPGMHMEERSFPFGYLT